MTQEDTAHRPQHPPNSTLMPQRHRQPSKISSPPSPSAQGPCGGHNTVTRHPPQTAFWPLRFPGTFDSFQITLRRDYLRCVLPISGCHTGYDTRTPPSIPRARFKHVLLHGDIHTSAADIKPTWIWGLFTMYIDSLYQTGLSSRLTAEAHWGHKDSAPMPQRPICVSSPVQTCLSGAELCTTSEGGYDTHAPSCSLPHRYRLPDSKQQAEL